MVQLKMGFSCSRKSRGPDRVLRGVRLAEGVEPTRVVRRFERLFVSSRMLEQGSAVVDKGWIEVGGGRIAEAGRGDGGKEGTG